MISFPFESRPGIFAPTWLPGSTKFKVIQDDGEDYVGICNVGPEVQALTTRIGGAYHAVEHLILVDGPLGRTTYPRLSPRMGLSHGGELHCEAVNQSKTADTLLADAQALLPGAKVSYYVAGIDYFLGKPLIEVDPLAGQSKWMDELTLNYSNLDDQFNLLGFVFAESVDGDEFIVHQCNYDNLELMGNLSASLRVSPWNGGANLRGYFTKVSRMLPTAKGYLYARAYVRRVHQNLNIASLTALSDPPAERLRLPEVDKLKGCVPRPPDWK